MIYRFVIFVFIIGVFGLASCKNNDEVLPVINYTNLNVVNASADTLNYYLNGTRQNNGFSLYPGGQTAYLTPPSGLQNYQFKNMGSFTVLFSVPLTLQVSTSASPVYYSLYAGGRTADEAFITQDQLYQDTIAYSTQIKFVNASPTAGSLDFYVGDTLNYKSLPFKGTSAFLATGSGVKQVQVYQSGLPGPIIDTPVTFQAGYIYSIFSRGAVKGKGTAAFHIGILLNSTNGG